MFRYLERHFSRIWLLVFSIDFLILLTIVVMALRTMTTDLRNTDFRFIQVSFAYLAAFMLLSLVMLFINELYTIEKKYHPWLLTFKCIISFTFASLCCYFLFYRAISHRALFHFTCMLTLIACVSILCWRFISYRILPRINIQQRVLFWGADDLNKGVVKEILADAHPKFKVVGFVDNNPALTGNLIMDRKVLGRVEDLDSIIKTEKVEKLITPCSQARGDFPAQNLIDLKFRGIEVLDIHTFYERLKGKILLNGLRPSWLIYSQGFKKTRLTKFHKRAFDILTSSFGLIVTLPVSIITALLIKLESKGPVIYRQQRVGENGRIFNLFKFRSMKADAEHGTGPVWARKNDHRITRVGKFIRKVRIDEIPQMVNVLRGDMSFVGPRPERPYFVEMLTAKIPYYNQRHSIKPGITGWAAVNYDYGATVEDAVEKLQYDLYYIKNCSLSLDVIVILKTIATVFGRKGSR
ncbi:MAG: TIGR03013 family XrtA/PEP-CTERM system glycosyltransferase [bacterium]